VQGTAAPPLTGPERAAAAAAVPAAEATDAACTDGSARLCEPAASGDGAPLQGALDCHGSAEAAHTAGLSPGVQGMSSRGGDKLALLPVGITTYTEART